MTRQKRIINAALTSTALVLGGYLAGCFLAAEWIAPTPVLLRLGLILWLFGLWKAYTEAK